MMFRAGPGSSWEAMMRRRELIGAGLAAAAASVGPSTEAATRDGAAQRGGDPAAAARDRAGSTRPSGRPRIGLALGSGSIHGLAHVGVLRVLERHGLRPDLVAGTSAGAIVGALYASGLPIDTIDEIARGLDWQQSGSLTWPGRGLMSNAPLQRRVEDAVGGRRIEAMPLPLGIVATTLADGARMLIRAGETGLAVGASSCIPVLFVPVRVEGRDCVDGSLVEPVPVDSARTMGADFVIAVDVAYRPMDEKPKGISDIAFQMMHIMINSLLSEQIPRADFALRLDVHRLMLGAWNAQMLIDEGERVAHAAWPELALALRRAGYELRETNR